MRLYDAARAFDNMPCTDGYTGTFLFNGQINNYDDSKRDAEATERRVISTAPDVVVPTRRVVLAAGRRWILGHSNPDSYRGEVIRLGWIAHEATDLAQVRTLAQACEGGPGFQAWCGNAWIKNLADSSMDSELAGQFHLHFAAPEPIRQLHLVTKDANHFLVREAHVGPAGTRVVLADSLGDEAVASITLAGVTMNTVSEVTSQVTYALTAVISRWQSIFWRTHEAAPKFGPGEMQIIVASSQVTPKVGWTATTPFGSFRIDSVLQQPGVHVCKASLR